VPRSKIPSPSTARSNPVVFNETDRDMLAELLDREGELDKLEPLFDEVEHLVSDYPEFSGIDKKYTAENFLAAIKPLRNLMSRTPESSELKTDLKKLIKALDPCTRDVVISALNSEVTESGSDTVALINAARGKKRGKREEREEGAVLTYKDSIRVLEEPLENLQRLQRVIIDLIDRLSSEHDEGETRGRPFEEARMVIICRLLTLFYQYKLPCDDEAKEREDKLEFLESILNSAGIPWPTKRDKKISLLNEASERLSELSPFPKSSKP